jgi:hypothetical protein
MTRLHLNLTALVALTIAAGGCLQRDITENLVRGRERCCDLGGE